MILRVAITEAADPAHIVEALLECREAAIGPSAAARRLIILRFGARCGGNTFMALPGLAWLSSINPRRPTFIPAVRLN
jgi:hypothetical protein